MYKNLLRVSLALFALTGSALADLTQCYYCDGRSETICEDPVNVTLLSICDLPTNPTSMLQSSAFKNSKLALKPENLSPVSDQGGFTCAKIVFSDSNEKFTMRTCSYAKINDQDMCDYLEDLSKDSDVKVDCNTCDTNLCNSAPRVAISLLSFIGLFVLFAL